MRPGRRLYHGKVVKSTQRKKKERKENREVSEKEGGVADSNRVFHSAAMPLATPSRGGDLRLSPSRW